MKGVSLLSLLTLHLHHLSLKEADESLNFEEQILEAAKSIAAATSALVKAASAAQRELVAQGKVSSSTGPGSRAAAWCSTLTLGGRLQSAESTGLSELLPPPQVGAIPANALDDGQWSQGLISAVSVQLSVSEIGRLEKAEGSGETRTRGVC